MPITPLTPDKLRFVCDANQFEFATTADLTPRTTIIGQPRGTRAIEFGMGIQSHGYNIYALGQMGTGRATALERFLQNHAVKMLRPTDWLYVHNFQTPHQPQALELAAGEGKLFQERMGRLLADLQNELPRAFDTDSYRDAVRDMRVQFERQRDELLRQTQAQASQVGFALLNTPSGLVAGPVREGQPLTIQDVQQMTPEQQLVLEQEQLRLNEALEETLDEVRLLESQARTQVEQIDREVAAAAIKHCFTQMRGMYEGKTAVLTYLNALHDDVLNSLDTFAPTDDEDGQSPDLRRYEVNLLVNNADTEGAPVIMEMNPTYFNLFGRIEYEMINGMATTHFGNIKCGALHWANGGFLLLYAADLLKYPDAWDALKRALKSAQILVQQPNMFNENAPVLAKSLSPEPIPLHVKIVLLGNPELYYALYHRDEEFSELFKVRADFDSRMPRTPEGELAYAEFVATRCHEENLRHFDKTAVAKVVEYGARLAEEKGYLSTRFGAIADLVREASFWAGTNGRSLVTATDVAQAIEERTERNNHVEKRIQESILKNSIFIATDGEVIGQVNGLTIIDLGDYAFGQPGRITARTYMGEDGVVHIERQTEMSGPIHDKGLLTLMGYLGGTYARNQPLSLSASLTFEQNYGGIDGDSASSTELYALLSSLAELPIQQGIAVTGSVNQRGEVQPIGGVNEKIEGFFKICAARGLTGSQGVLIPASNVDELMLDEAVVTAVSANQFHIWSITTVDEGIEVLTGVPAGMRNPDGSYLEGTVHQLVQDRLLKLALDLKSFGHEGDDNEDEEKED
ncbi:MAG: AAA family ATPase [Anaerolineales bacterium]|nr:AAA family ATPase [Anaerolineales bacterium]